MRESLKESLLSPNWKANLSSLIQSKSITSDSFIDSVDYLIARGKRVRALKVINFFKQNNLFSLQLCLREINSLLVIGHAKKASRLFSRYKKQYDLPFGYRDRVNRYLCSDELIQSADAFIDLARKLLWLDFENYLNFGGQSYLKSLKGIAFSDIIVISNSPTIRFDPEDCDRIKAMKKPLFIYLNIGNPTFSRIRQLLYSTNSYELLIGNPSFLMSNSSELLFNPLCLDRFIGCFVLARRRMLLAWHSKLREQMVVANPDVNFFHFHSLIALQSIYPLSTFRDSSQLLKQRIPTVGCLALMLAFSLSTFSDSFEDQSFTSKSCNLWVSGFSMSASYIFEACAGIELHDFVFERVVQQRLMAGGFMRVLGHSNQMATECSAEQHLVQVGLAPPARRSTFDQAIGWENN